MTDLTRRLALAALLGLLIPGLLALGHAVPASALARFEQSALAIMTASGGRHTFEVELALTQEQQAQGLMFRRTLAENAGMLFVYKPAREISMWMKNTMIPLDMLFIASDGQIVKIVERTVPLSEKIVESDQRVQAVLELNAGTASRLGIKPGDRVLHSAFGTAP
ncbi:MAG: DUF192 domain-containing protein [Kiloniellales bacterium]|nr:DUF192 domain-containing protein [Kiloniellales bacterium]